MDCLPRLYVPGRQIICVGNGSKQRIGWTAQAGHPGTGR